MSTPTATITPDDLYDKARHLRVDLAAEPFLLPLIRQAVATPLPPQWTVEASNDSGDHDHDTKRPPLYRNTLTGALHDTHPADAYFLKQIHELRRFHEAQEHSDGNDDGELADGNQATAAAPRSLPSSGWMEFADASGARDAAYYYDFVTKTTQRTRPRAPLAGAAAEVSPLATLDGARADKVFEHAARLHKSPSMKNLAALEILCFTSWWTESALAGSTKVYLQLYFSIPTRHFQIAVDDSDEVFTVSHLVGPSGRVVGAWDLHVGARLQILGRWTTLMQPSLLTRQWLDLHARQFETTKRELEAELLKYELHSAHSRKPLTGQIQCAEPHKSTSGVSLRKLLGEMDTLKSRLAKYRPDVARRFVLPYDVDE